MVGKLSVLDIMCGVPQPCESFSHEELQPSMRSEFFLMAAPSANPKPPRTSSQTKTALLQQLRPNELVSCNVRLHKSSSVTLGTLGHLVH